MLDFRPKGSTVIPEIHFALHNEYKLFNEFVKQNVYFSKHFIKKRDGIKMGEGRKSKNSGIFLDR